MELQSVPIAEAMQRASLLGLLGQQRQRWRSGCKRSSTEGCSRRIRCVGRRCLLGCAVCSESLGASLVCSLTWAHRLCHGGPPSSSPSWMLAWVRRCMMSRILFFGVAWPKCWQRAPSAQLCGTTGSEQPRGLCNSLGPSQRGVGLVCGGARYFS